MKEVAFIKLTDTFKDKLFRMAKRLLVSTEEAEDATQEILLKLWKNKSSITGYKNVEAFAMTMTKNFCFDKLKAKESENMKLVHSNYSSREASLHRKTEAKDTMDWVQRVMNELPAQQRMIVQLRDIEQYDNHEIAKMLDMNETAVRVSLSRARKWIRTEIEKKHSYGIT
ncbi:sigma-70 family RNA polymerase sigma factor [Aquimarina sp. ERC-38]|uniref:RNA polymerase sigma factor n=1 Tax=Aquimarina sp. ERC-38 TaxID=2949996 RepID=UPI0022471DD4|nr:sigma-70 family RNA polymerase sigma factor [Aquimarina sp. ERC-38]UZO80766.1 sigma-70 family RNA polymerase sigma factor [Aquimarina sp. ERC-38]